MQEVFIGRGIPLWRDVYTDIHLFISIARLREIHFVTCDSYGANLRIEIGTNWCEQFRQDALCCQHQHKTKQINTQLGECKTEIRKKIFTPAVFESFRSIYSTLHSANCM